MLVRDLMHKPAISCGPDTNLAAAAALMWEHDCGALPVVEPAGPVTGILTDRDVCIALGTRNRPASEITAREVASTHLCVCSPDEDVRQALRRMCRSGVRRLPVIGRNGALEGMLSIHDVLLRAQHSDGTKRPGVSYEDAVNTLVGICRGAGCRKLRVA